MSRERINSRTCRRANPSATLVHGRECTHGSAGLLAPTLDLAWDPRRQGRSLIRALSPSASKADPENASPSASLIVVENDNVIKRATSSPTVESEAPHAPTRTLTNLNTSLVRIQPVLSDVDIDFDRDVDREGIDHLVADDVAQAVNFARRDFEYELVVHL